MRRIPKPGEPPSRRQSHRPVRLSPAEAAREHFRRNNLDIERHSILVVGSRLGTVERLPERYQPAPCWDCGRQVWVNGTLLLSFKVKVLCDVCLPVPTRPA